MVNSDSKCRVLWIAPNLNHYRKRMLSHLSTHGRVEIVVLAGRTPTDSGHRDDEISVPFELIEVEADKRRFCFRIQTYFVIFKCLYGGRFDVVLMPLEKKLLPIVAWVWVLRFFMGFRMMSYNHPVMRSRSDRITGGDLRWTRWLFKLYNRIIFYTQKAMEDAVEKKLLEPDKASFANNTLDTQNILQNTSFEINSNSPPRLLFIGRLVANKRIDLLLDYFAELKKAIPELALTIIGDGPEEGLVKKAVENEQNIRWTGGLVDEKAIAKEMRKAHIVFIPGWSGLSIVHAFLYGKPYITLAGMLHAPELAYLENGTNGYLLDGSFQENTETIIELLCNHEVYSTMCTNAKLTAHDLSIENWCEQMSKALMNRKND